MFKYKMYFTTNELDLSNGERLFIDRLRGLSILRVLLSHLGLAWFYLPYSTIVITLLPLLYFVSGAVSYNSYMRSCGIVDYLIRRIITLVFPYYIVILMVSSLTWLFNFELPKFDAEIVLSWITLNPPVRSHPYPLGQVWFLHSLVIVTIFSAVFFRLINSKLMLSVVILTSVMVSWIQMTFPLSKYLTIFDHRIYNSVVAISFYLYGAMLFRFNSKSRILISVLTLLVASVAIILLFANINLSLDFRLHSYSMDLYYVLAAFIGISIFMLMQKPINVFCDRLKVIDGLLKYTSKNSYSIFMIHSFFILFVENYFGLVNVKSNYGLALFKIFIVMTLSLIAAAPITCISNFIVGKVVSRWRLVQKSQKVSLSPTSV